MPIVPLSGSLQILELALGAPARQRTALQGGDAGRVVAAILQPFERVDQLPGDGFTAQNSNNPAQGASTPLAQWAHDSGKRRDPTSGNQKPCPDVTT